MYAYHDAAAKSRRTAHIQTILGFILGGITLISFVSISAAGNLDTDFFIIVLMLGGTIALLVKGSKIKKRMQRFDNYVSLISSGIATVEDIATATMQTPMFVRLDLQYMRTRGYFAHTGIDLTRLNLDGAPAQPFMPPHLPPTHTVPPHMIPPGHPARHLSPGHPGHMPMHPHGHGHAVSFSPPPPVTQSYSCQGCGAAGTKQQGVPLKCEYCDSMIN